MSLWSKNENFWDESFQDSPMRFWAFFQKKIFPDTSVHVPKTLKMVSKIQNKNKSSKLFTVPKFPSTKMKNKSSTWVQKNKMYIIINNMSMSAPKPYVGYISNVYIHYSLWNIHFRVDKYVISVQFLNYLISCRSSQEIWFWTLWSKYVWYDVNWHYISILIILFGVNMDDSTQKTYNMINLRL